MTIFLAILVNFNVSTAESCFHRQRAGSHGHILSYREKIKLVQMFSAFSFPKQDICFSDDCNTGISSCQIIEC